MRSKTRRSSIHSTLRWGRATIAGAAITALASLVVPVTALVAEEAEGFSRERRANGSMFIRAQPGSLPFDGESWPVTTLPVEREHYPWDPEELAAARSEALVSPEIQEGWLLRQTGGDGSAANFGGSSRAPARGITFEGLNAQTASFQGSRAFPPDATLGVSKTKVLQGSNVALRLTDRTGLEVDRMPLNNFFGFVGNSLLFDPKVFFDRLSGRFYVVALEQQQNPNTSGIWLAVSKGSDPSALAAPDQFCTYRIPSNRGGSWADYPLIGINEQWFAVSVNNFRFNNGNFKRAYIYVLPVEQITDNAESCPNLGIKRFDPHNGADGTPVFSVHPAQHYSTATEAGEPLFMVSAGFNLPSSIYTLWRIKTGAGNQPTLSKQLLTGDFAYFFAPVAGQIGGADLDSGDPRITQAAYRNGKVWAVHGTACAIGPLPNEGCVRAVEITPNEGGAAAISYSETFGRQNQFLFWPGIAINKLGDVVMAFQKARNNAYLGVVFNGKRAGAPHFDVMKNLRVGNCTLLDLDFSGNGLSRTGDYVGIQTDPLESLGFWLTGEYPGRIGGAASGCDWKTYVGRAQY